MSENHVHGLSVHGCGENPPRFIKLGRHVRYRAEDILDWIESGLSE